MTFEHEIAKPSELLGPRGELLQVGWCRQPLLTCNLEKAAPKGIPLFLRPWRIKKWDYYGFFTPTHFFSVTLADIGYAGSIFAYILDHDSLTLTEQTVTVPFAKGILLPRNSWEGRSSFDGGGLHVALTATPTRRNVEVRWPNFSGKPLSFHLELATPAAHESMAIVTPMGSGRFYWNRKLPCLPVHGNIAWGDDSWTLTPDSSHALLDWGRGVWPYRSHWVWACASGFLPSGLALGLNLGCGFGDTSRATENALWLGGKIHKLKNVRILFDDSDYMRPWSMRDEEGRLDVTFTPTKERIAKTNLALVMTEVHQMFGRYDGWVSSDTGERITIEALRGFAEEHHARW